MANPSQPNNSDPTSHFDWPKKISKCLYCWAPDQYLKRHNQVFQDDLNLNRIHLGDNQKVYLGTYTPEARHICMSQGKPSRESVTDTEKLRYLSLHFANVQTLRISDADPDSYSSDEEV